MQALESIRGERSLVISRSTFPGQGYGLVSTSTRA
jgi:hypothetical protein